MGFGCGFRSFGGARTCWRLPASTKKNSKTQVFLQLCLASSCLKRRRILRIDPLAVGTACSQGADCCPCRPCVQMDHGGTAVPAEMGSLPQHPCSKVQPFAAGIQVIFPWASKWRCCCSSPSVLSRHHSCGLRCHLKQQQPRWYNSW